MAASHPDADSDPDSLAQVLRIVSVIFGWVYTLSWSASFYPQALLNYQRRSTRGTTIDFPAVNVLGFLAYFVSNAVFLYSPLIRREYAQRHHGLEPTVRFNDLVFAGHASVLAIIILSQFSKKLWGFEKGRDRERRMSMPIAGIFVGSFVGVAAVAMIVLVRADEDAATGWGWIDVVYTISYVKLVVTVVKYAPQVLTNYRNRSTQGWAISGMLFDFAGGVLSIAQLCIDSYLQGDWSGITGNPVKLALGNISIFYDLIFIVQHYWLYKGQDIKQGPTEDDPLLSGSEERD